MRKPAQAPPPSILTAQYGNLRQGYNASESMLTSGCISGGTVSPAPPSWAPLVVEPGVSGLNNRVQAQPLYVSQVSTTPALNNCPNPCNMLVAPTLTDGVYAWNADTGAVIWSDCQQPGCTGHDLWYEDCGSTAGPSLAGYGGTAGLPFAGVVSTPVIDTSVSPPVVYVTSLCETAASPGAQKWWIHRLNLYTGADQVTPQQIGGTVTGSDGADDLTGNSIPFNAWETMQRAALLQVKVSGTGTPNNLIYAAFGFGYGPGGEITTPYHGWVFGYGGLLTRRIEFVTTAKGWGSGSNTDAPACTANCTCSGTSCLAGSGCVASYYAFAPNWCGHAGGIWMSGRGPAANPDSSGNSHAYFGVGNGGFQQTNSSGTLLSSIQNWGNSVLDFPLQVSGGGAYQTPSEYFTPYGGTNVPLQQGLTTGAANPVADTFEGLSQNDFDMAVSGIILFDDPGGNHRLLTIDKAGYAYLLTQGNICGSSSGCYPGASGGGPGGVTNDLGNLFSFAANQAQCPDQIDAHGGDTTCDRVTSMALFKDGSPPYLYVWPSYEVLTGLQLSDDSSQSGPGTITATGGTTVTGSGTSFTSHVVPGDMLIAGGCSPPSCPIITIVNSDTQLTISSSLTVSGAPWNYSGYFINPIYDAHPTDTYVQYPGGTLTVTSNSGSDPVVWGLVNLQNPGPPPGPLVGALYAYNATNLSLLWCSNSASCPSYSISSFTNATFALPTVANGYVYIPTAGITSVSTNSACTSTSPCSGIMVYSGH